MSIQFFEKRWEKYAFLFRLSWQINRFAKGLFFMFLLTIFCIRLSSGQTPHTSFILEPTTFEDDEIISLKILYGTQDTPASNVLSIDFIFECEGFTIDNNSQLELDLSNSWFAEGNNWEGTIETSSNGERLIVSLDKTNEVPASGYGEIALVKGILVDLEDVIGKRAETPGIRLIESRELSSCNSNYRIFPNPARTQVTIAWNPGIEIIGLKLSNYMAQSLFNVSYPKENKITLNLSPFNPGVYFIELKSDEGILEKKKLLIKY